MPGVRASCTKTTRCSPRTPLGAIAAARPVALGLDFAVDAGKPWPNHTTLLGVPVLLIENLMGLTALPANGFEVIAFPLRLAGENGGPARVVANIPR